MYRRAILSVLAGSVFAVAGCLETDQQPLTNQSTANRPRTISSAGMTAELRVTDSFMRSSTREDAAASFVPSEIVVRGIYRPPTACHTLSLSALERTEDGAIRLTIASMRGDDSEGVCEGAYTVYRIRIRGSDLPSSVHVIHSQSGRKFGLTESNPGALPQIPEHTTKSQNSANRPT
jgi:hypothetical protein